MGTEEPALSWPDLCAPGHDTVLWRLSFSSAPDWGHSFRSQGSQEGILASRLARTTGLMGVLCGPVVDLGEAEPGLGQWVPTAWTAEVATGPALASCNRWLWGSGDLNPPSPELTPGQSPVRGQSWWGYCASDFIFKRWHFPGRNPQPPVARSSGWKAGGHVCVTSGGRGPADLEDHVHLTVLEVSLSS